MDKWLKCPVACDSGEGSEEPTEKHKKDAKTKLRQYHENYILYGFTSTLANPLQPQSYFCGEVLANNSMKPAHLQRHQSTKHLENVGKREEFYKQKLSEFESGQTVMMKAMSVSNKTLEASYAVSLLVAKSKKPHSIVEELILPAATVMAEIMIDKKAVDALKRVPLSNNTVSRRINDMSDNIIRQVVNKIKQAGEFVLQLDEMTDLSAAPGLRSLQRHVGHKRAYFILQKTANKDNQGRNVSGYRQLL